MQDDIPLRPPPSGAHSNFASPHTLVPAVIGSTAVMLALTLPCVVLRLLVKRRFMRSFWWDDSDIVDTCVLATIGSVIFAITTLCNIPAGFGRHMWDVPQRNLTDQVVRNFIASDIVYGPCFFFIKTSILLFYHRMFSVGSGPLLRRLIWLGVVFQLIFYAAFTTLVAALIAPCGSVARLSEGGICEDVAVAAVVQAALNVVTDFYVLLLPLLVIRRLRLPRKRKIGVTAIFLTGLVACASSVARLAFIPSWLRSSDSFWVGAHYFILLNLEINLGIIVACMPFLPLFFQRCVRDSRVVASLRRRVRSPTPSFGGFSAKFSGIGGHGGGNDNVGGGNGTTISTSTVVIRAGSPTPSSPASRASSFTLPPGAYGDDDYEGGERDGSGRRCDVCGTAAADGNCGCYECDCGCSFGGGGGDSAYGAVAASSAIEPKQAYLHKKQLYSATADTINHVAHAAVVEAAAAAAEAEVTAPLRSYISPERRIHCVLDKCNCAGGNGASKSVGQSQSHSHGRHVTCGDACADADDDDKKRHGLRRPCLRLKLHLPAHPRHPPVITTAAPSAGRNSPLRTPRSPPRSPHHHHNHHHHQPPPPVGDIRAQTTITTVIEQVAPPPQRPLTQPAERLPSPPSQGATTIVLRPA